VNVDHPLTLIDRDMNRGGTKTTAALLLIPSANLSFFFSLSEPYVAIVA